jgi:hypothetical protein
MKRNKMGRWWGQAEDGMRNIAACISCKLCDGSVIVELTIKIPFVLGHEVKDCVEI